MAATLPRFRTSTRYGRFYKDRTTSLSFVVDKWDDVLAAFVPVDLSAYSSVKFQAFLTDATSSLTKNEDLTVDAVNLIDGVKARCYGTVKFTATADAVRCQVVLVTGSESEIVEAQWEADVHVGGPTS